MPNLLNLKEIRKAGVADEEMVARAMFSPSFFKRSGAIGAQAFFLTPFNGNKEKEISVIREKMCPDICAAVKKITSRKDGDNVCGIAELNVGAIRSLSYIRGTDDVNVDVKATPSPNMLFHAGIVIRNHNRRYSSEDNGTQPIPVALMTIMNRLAHISSYVPFVEENNGAEGGE